MTLRQHKRLNKLIMAFALAKSEADWQNDQGYERGTIISAGVRLTKTREALDKYLNKLKDQE